MEIGIKSENYKGDISNYNHFIIFNFLLMNNISITIEMFIDS